MKLIRWLIEAWNKRPAEIRQSSAGAALAAAMFIYGWIKANGIDFDGLNDPQVQAAVLLISTQVSAVVTWIKAIQQRNGELGSAEDGTVTPE